MTVAFASTLRCSSSRTESPTTIPIYDIECGEDESVGKEETELFEQILVQWNLLTPRSYFIIGVRYRRSSPWGGILSFCRQRGRRHCRLEDLLEKLQYIWRVHLPPVGLGSRQGQQSARPVSVTFHRCDGTRMARSTACTQKIPA